jgi:hypothetical protein
MSELPPDLANFVLLDLSPLEVARQVGCMVVALRCLVLLFVFVLRSLKGVADDTSGCHFVRSH